LPYFDAWRYSILMVRPSLGCVSFLFMTEHTLHARTSIDLG
jgi:hypothetical protein